MNKTATNNKKELYASIPNFDTKYLDEETIGLAMLTLFEHDNWRDVIDRRNKVIESSYKAGANTNAITTALTKLSQRLGDMMLCTVANVSMDVQTKTDSHVLSPDEFRRTFVDTPEKQEAYDKYVKGVIIVQFLLDTVYGYVKDLREQLEKVNPNTNSNQFVILEKLTKEVDTMSFQSHRDEHPEIKELFMDYADQVNEYMDGMFDVFFKELRSLRNDLQKRGEIMQGSDKSVRAY